MGNVRFRGFLIVTGRILAKAGTGIEAGDSIEARWGIKAGEGIEAGESIEAGWGIKAGSGIKAGNTIKAGESIEAGLAIRCKRLSARFRVFAGLVMWRMPLPNEYEVECTEMVCGIIAHGDLRLVVPPSETKDAK